MSTNHKSNQPSITLKEVLDDLSSRFILNCPEEEYQSFERLYFQIEEAFWFYMDFYRITYPNLPSLSLKKFGQKIFEHCPLLFQYYHAYDEVFDLFNHYKCSVPVMGAIMLNPSMSKLVLVQGWKSKTWSFPRGKISRAEKEEQCAIREVLEETGYDISAQLRPNHYIERTLSNRQRAKMFIIPNVSENTKFETQTRNEIRNIEWFSISKLNNWKSNKNSPFVKKFKLYKVLTFMKELNLWIFNEKKGKHKNERQFSNFQQNEKPKIPIQLNDSSSISKPIKIQEQIPHPKSMPNLDHSYRNSSVSSSPNSTPLNTNTSFLTSSSLSSPLKYQHQQLSDQQSLTLNSNIHSRVTSINTPSYHHYYYYDYQHSHLNHPKLEPSLNSRSVDSFFDTKDITDENNSMSGFKFDTQDLLGVLN